MKWNTPLKALALMTLLVCIAVPAYGREKAEPGPQALSQKDLGEIVDLLEDPQKREAFVKNLKNLMAAKEAASGEAGAEGPKQKEKEILVIEKFFSAFDTLSQRFIEAAASTASLAARAPDRVRDAWGFLSRPENRSKLIRLLVDIAGAVAVALILGLILRKYTPRPREAHPAFPSRLAFGLARILLRLIPYGAILVVLSILFGVLPSFALGQALVFLLFVILLCYRIAFEVFRVILAPEDGTLRLLPLTDENANYYWIWFRRFANYGALYFLVTSALGASNLASPSFAFIRGILLVVFPLMISIFILQAAREVRTMYGPPPSETGTEQDPRRMKGFVIRYWPVLAIAYAWAISLFLIFQYDRGFKYLLVATVETGIAVLALFLVLRILDRIFNRLFAINKRVKARFPGLEEKTNRYIRIFRKILDGVVVIIGLGVIAQVWGVPVSTFVASRAGTLVIVRAITILITLGVVVAVIGVSQFVGGFLLKEQRGGKKREVTQKMKTLVPVVKTAVRIAAGFVGGIIILESLGVNTTPILAGAGIIGLAVGFGAQTLVKDLITGLFILFEESIRVGDWASVGNKGGNVEAIGLRTVKLRDLNGNVHVVPNSSIDAVTNLSKEYSRAVMDVGVAYREDVDEVMKILKEVGEDLQSDPEYGLHILEPLEIFGLDRFEDSAVVIRTRFKTTPLKQWGIRREFNRRLKKRFDAEGIEIPFPHTTVYMGEPKKGTAPPLEVHIEEGEKPSKD